jgi:hypothetical protein
MESKVLRGARLRGRQAAVAVVLFGVLALVVVLGSAGSAAATGRATGGAVPCGPVGAKTLAVEGPIRIFRNGPAETPVRACERDSSHLVTLGMGGTAAQFAIFAPWVGAIETKAVGQDSLENAVVGANVESGEKVRCLLSKAKKPGQMTKVHSLYAARNGNLVIAGRLRLAPVGPVVAVCRYSENALEVIARGSKVALGSVKVVGNYVHWTEAGEKHTAPV